MRNGVTPAEASTEIRSIGDEIATWRGHDRCCPYFGWEVLTDGKTCSTCDFIEIVRADERAEVLARFRHGRSVNDRSVPLTSRPTDTQAGAARKAVLKVGTRRKEIYDLIVTSPDGMTDDEIEIATGYTHQSASGARNSLMRDGFIWDSGERRKNRRGNLSIVWKEAA